MCIFLANQDAPSRCTATDCLLIHMYIFVLELYHLLLWNNKRNLTWALPHLSFPRQFIQPCPSYMYMYAHTILCICVWEQNIPRSWRCRMPIIELGNFLEVTHTWHNKWGVQKHHYIILSDPSWNLSVKYSKSSFRFHIFSCVTTHHAYHIYQYSRTTSSWYMWYAYIYVM